jgi:hypothetical protein
MKSSKNSIENSIKRTFPSDINKNKYTGIKQRNTPIEERAKYVINLEKIINEKDQRTTLMIKNIPRNIMQSFLMEIINKKFEGLFNFFYLPIDFIKKENAGDAFINFKNSKNIVDFYIASAKLVIELDGSQHYEAEGQQKDAERDGYLVGLGCKVLRYSNADVNQRFFSVCEDIYKHLSLDQD